VKWKMGWWIWRMGRVVSDIRSDMEIRRWEISVSGRTSVAMSAAHFHAKLVLITLFTHVLSLAFELVVVVAISHSFSFDTCRITSYRCIQTFHFSCLSL